MNKYIHPADADWQRKKAVIEAIKIVKKSKAKLIWCQNLWPYYNVQNARPKDLFDPYYYIREIKNLRRGVNKIGADFCALDTEPYAYAPVKRYFKGINRIKLTKQQWNRVRLCVEKTIQAVGKVDFVMPAAYWKKDRPYNILAELGNMRIAEDTFWSNEEMLRRITYPYEIFGAYVNTVRLDENHPKLWHYLVPEIFEKPQRWSDKRGLFLYPKGKNSLAAARELVAYAESLPNVNSFKPTDQNNP